MTEHSCVCSLGRVTGFDRLMEGEKMRDKHLEGSCGCRYGGICCGRDQDLGGMRSGVGRAACWEGSLCIVRMDFRMPASLAVSVAAVTS